MLLTQIADTSQPTMVEMHRMYTELATLFNESVDLLTEAVTPVAGDLDMQLSELSKRFEAAKRGLSIAHRLPAGPDKKRHMSAILTNMNIIRGMVSRVARQVADVTDAEDSFSNAQSGYEQGQGYAEQEEEMGAPDDQSSGNEYDQAVSTLRGILGHQ